MGYKEGLSIGRRIGYDEGRGRRLTGPSDRPPPDPLSLEDHEHDESITDEERIDPRSRIQLRSVASVRGPPYVNDRVTRASLPTLITECAPNRRRLYVRSMTHMRRHFLSHHAIIPSAPTHLLMSVARPLRLMNLMNQKLFARYRSTIAPISLPSTSTSLPMDGSQQLILARPTSLCHPRTNCSNPSPPHPVPSRPRSRIADLRINMSQLQSRPLSGRATMLIRRPFRHLFQFNARPRSHPVPRPISHNMIW